jgi:NADPH2:quinone reductase
VAVARRRMSSMTRAAVCKALGDRLQAADDWPVKELTPDAVRIRVAAAGVNFADVLTVKGLYQDRSEPPFVPGNEMAGEVIEVGELAAQRGFTLGDRVISLARGGAFAAEATVSASHCLKLPASTASKDLAEAAALLCNYGTAHLALKHRANLQRGESVLVTAAAGGVGLATVELANLMGAGRVIAAASSEEKIALAVTKGATAGAGVNYTGIADDGKAFRAALKPAAGEAGVDVFVDMVGGALLEAGVRSLNWNGRAVVIGFAGGTIPRLPANILLVKNVSVAGLFWGAHLIHDPRTLLSSAHQLVEWWAAGEIAPAVCARLPLEKANDAFELIEGRASTGKVVLVP